MSKTDGIERLPASAGSESQAKRRIRRAIEARGYAARLIEWNAIRHGGIMCGPEGGWHVELDKPRPLGIDADLLAYSFAELMSAIQKLPIQNADYPDQLSR